MTCKLNESLVLSPEALAIYNEKREQVANEQTGSSDDPNMEEIMKSIYNQINAASRDRMFHSLLSKYWRIFQLAAIHYTEIDKAYKEYNSNTPHVFNITFSNIHAYLNPKETIEDELDNLGCVYYMFNFKSDKHRYLISPPTIWRLFNHMFTKHPNADKILKDEQIKNFYNCIDEKHEIDFNQLMNCYYATDGLQRMIDVAVDCKPGGKLEESLKIIQKMLKDRLIEPIERFVDREKTPIEIDKERYDEALGNLNLYRRDGGIKNKLIALNIAMSCYLTEQKIKTTFFDADDKLYASRPTYYRAVANSRQSVEALRRLKDNADTYVSCCPQFLSTLILLNKSLANELGLEGLKESINYFNAKSECLERLRNKCFDMQYPQRFTAPEYCQSTKLLKKNLSSTYTYLRDLIIFGEQILPAIIEHVLEINRGNLAYHNVEGNKNYNSYESVESEQIFTQLKYEKTVKEDFKSIYEAVKETYKFLYEYVTKKNLMVDMGFAQEKITKLAELYNKVTSP